MRPLPFLLRALFVFAAATPAAHADLLILGQTGEGVIDRTNGLAWIYSSGHGDAINQGYRIATLEETKLLFQERHAQADAYYPGGGTISADGLRYRDSVNLGWSGTNPTLTDAFGAVLGSCNLNDNCAPAPGNTFYAATSALVLGANGAEIPVLIENQTFGNQYGRSDTEYGTIDPQGVYFGGSPQTTLPTNYFSNGVLKTSGYLLVKSVPEPGTYALVGLGLAGAGFVARRRRQSA